MSLTVAAILIGVSDFRLFRPPTSRESFWRGIAFFLLIVGGICTALLSLSLIREFSSRTKLHRPTQANE
jgi:hypothetical protein